MKTGYKNLYKLQFACYLMFIHPQKQWQEEQRKTSEERKAEEEQRIEDFYAYRNKMIFLTEKMEKQARQTRIMVKSLEAA